MTLLEGLMQDHIFIDFDQELLYGSDQMDVNYPCRFATVMFELISTSFLATLADRIRKNLGFKPMHPLDEYTDETCDSEGWYDFFYGINALDGGMGDSTIEFCVVNSDSPDNEEMYTIDLTDQERDAMFKRIDAQCREHLGAGCREILAKADQQMREEFDAEDI